jgi:hypothetical protein
MTRRLIMALGIVVLLGSVLLAAEDEKGKAKKPVGTWKRTVGDNSVTFEIQADTLKCTIGLSGNSIEVEADYSVSKDGVLFGRISKVTKKGTDGGPSEGDLFSFKVAVDKDTMTTSELKSSAGDVGDAKELFEGEYKKEKKE